MSVLYLHFETSERPGRLHKLQKSGAHIVVAEPRWPSFFELAKREKPFAIAVDFSHAPSHALETSDYVSKAKETKDASLFLLRVPADRLEAVQKRLPKALIVTETELSGRLAEMEREAEARAREKTEAAARAKKAARAAARAGAAAAAGKAKPPAPSRAAAAAPKKAAAKALRPRADAKKKPTKRTAAARKTRKPPKKK
jgi:hypothetical protein